MTAIERPQARPRAPFFSSGPCAKRALLKLPDSYLVAFVPASDTGAMEMALWSLLGARGVDVLAWEAFGKDWIIDITRQLKLDDVRVMEAPYGALPDLAKVDCNRDVVFTWNGTTSGVRVPNADWIAMDRQGLTICDATSAIFAQPLDWAFATLSSKATAAA
jgi:phosphoserine aminotransferase